MPRLAFLKKGEVIEISMCDLDFAPRWCEVKDCDSWIECPIEHGKEDQTIRMMGVGDKITTAAKAIGANKQIDRAKVQEITPAVLNDIGAPTGTFKAPVTVKPKPAG